MHQMAQNSGWKGSAGYAGDRPTSVSVNAPITVNVPEGTPVQKIGGVIKEGFQSALDNIFRQTSMANKPVFEY